MKRTGLFYTPPGRFVRTGRCGFQKDEAYSNWGRISVISSVCLISEEDLKLLLMWPKVYDQQFSRCVHQERLERGLASRYLWLSVRSRAGLIVKVARDSAGYGA